MCKVSDKLKLCTCKTENVEQLNHYWILYKYQKSETILVGIPMLPQEFEIGRENDEINYKKLEVMLNEGNCFDIELSIANKDILELNLSYHPNTNTKQTIHLVYEFLYKKNKWSASQHDPFDTNKLEKNKGKIKSPFIKA